MALSCAEEGGANMFVCRMYETLAGPLAVQVCLESLFSSGKHVH